MLDCVWGRMKRWQGSKDLVFDAIEETTHLVERTHTSVAQKSVRPFADVEQLAVLAQAVLAVHDTIAAGVYKSIRGVSRSVETLLDAGTGLVVGEFQRTPGSTGFDLATPLRSDAQGSRSWWLDHAEGVLNGLYGDHLRERQNDLDLGMSLRQHGRILPVERKELERSLPRACGKLCVFVHGLSSTEWSWSISAGRFYGDPAVNFGSLLQADLGFTPLYVRYNSGQHISANGRLLSALLARLVAEYPVGVEELVLVGHSMGGLVARSAAYYGDTTGELWVQRLRHLFCLGSPNLGAPLEQGVNLVSSLLGAVDTAGTQVPAQVLNARSAGIKDLRFGYTVDEEWYGENPDALLQDHRQNVPFVDGVGYYFVAATLTRDPMHPLGRLLGDLLVRPPSAAGHAPEPARRIPFHSGRVFSGLNHFRLANHPQVYEAIRQCLEAAPLPSPETEE